MDCLKFQDSLSDYVEGTLDSRVRAECAGHRLVCRDCRELYTDVRATVQALNAIAVQDVEKPEGLESRIIAATTTGEMLSCNEFDRLIERYFDGVLLAPMFQTFQAHFEKCSKCRRLMSGIEEAIEICHELKGAEVDAPPSLQDRILAATVGNHKSSWLQHAKETLIGFSINVARTAWTTQMAAALLIFAASSLLILSRFGGVSGFVKEGQQKLQITSSMARNEVGRFGTMLLNGEAPASNPPAAQPQPSPSPSVQPPAPKPTPKDDQRLQQSVRYEQRHTPHKK